MLQNDFLRALFGLKYIADYRAKPAWNPKWDLKIHENSFYWQTMHRSIFYVGILAGLMLFAGPAAQAQAQNRERTLQEDMPTWVVKKKKMRNAAQKDKPRELPVRYIIIKETRGVLYGNPCAVQETQKMGFQYILLKKGQPGYENMWEKVDNNFNVKLGLIFRKSPFWKAILKKRIERCRRDTGDFVGYLDKDVPPYLAE